MRASCSRMTTGRHTLQELDFEPRTLRLAVENTFYKDPHVISCSRVCSVSLHWTLTAEANMGLWPGVTLLGNQPRNRYSRHLLPLYRDVEEQVVDKTPLSSFNLGILSTSWRYMNEHKLVVFIYINSIDNFKSFIWTFSLFRFFLSAGTFWREDSPKKCIWNMYTKWYTTCTVY